MRKTPSYVHGDVERDPPTILLLLDAKIGKMFLKGSKINASSMLYQSRGWPGRNDAGISSGACRCGGGEVLEKHVDFLRDFRGDTVHPSTLEVLYELGLLDEFLKRPHQEVHQIHGWVGDSENPP